MKHTLREKLPLWLKLRLKRLVFGTLGAALRLGARAYNFAERLGESAAANGLDLRQAWDVKMRPRAPHVEPWGATDFLFLARAAAGRTGERRTGGDDGRTINTSVVIPVFNKVEFTFQCLRSLLREVNSDDTEVIVVNNASTDETREVLSHFGGLVRVIENEINRGFVDACNQGAGIARGRFLVFLNNDTVVLPGWLDALVETAERDPRAGAVGSLFLYPDGRVQEAGAILWSNGEAFHYGWGRSPEDRRFTFAREVDYCSGASLLVRRELFERLGGFDRRYAPAYYEDADLCMGVRYTTRARPPGATRARVSSTTRSSTARSSTRSGRACSRASTTGKTLRGPSARPTASGPRRSPSSTTGYLRPTATPAARACSSSCARSRSGITPFSSPRASRSGPNTKSFCGRRASRRRARSTSDAS
ncbi:MAG: hypothetical protein DMF66_03590 [Acidobacteria bacterium]|nr:MAG: hypothetical protein DMF66_03590 [Acidobacteriota bacterium]